MSEDTRFIRRPLAGVRVLDFCRFLAGPYATWVMAELGADVIKVEDPEHPDDARSIGPFFCGGQSLYFAALNGGKRSLSLPLASPEAEAVLRRLLPTCDVVVSNSRPGVMAKLGLSSADLAARNPRLITCSLTGYGDTGPYASRPGYDYTIQALAGVMSMTGEPGGPPGKAGISYVDHSGGIAAALAICAGLVHRERTGVGGHIELALIDIQISMLSYLAAWHLNEGWEPARTADAAHASIVPAQNFATLNGYVSIFVGNDAIWRRLVNVLGDPLLGEQRYADGAGRRAGRTELLGHLATLLRGQTSEHWVSILAAAGVPCARVNDLGQALADEHVRARKLLRESVSPRYGGYWHVGGPFPQLGHTERPAPTLGEHTDEILAEIDALPG